MYAAEYGTDWETLTADEAIERAYALGVALTLGERHADELDRLIGAAGTADDRALVRLAYDKGRSRGRTARTEASDAEDAWASVVNDEEREPVEIKDERELPPALRQLPLLRGPGDGLARVRLPRFLLRGGRGPNHR